MSPLPFTDRDRCEDEHAQLAWLVEHFELDAPSSRKLIREMLDAGPRRFLRNGVAVLRKGPDSRGARYLVTLLLANNLLLPAVCDPSLTREQAAAVARGALRVDSRADVALARALVNRAPETLADPGRLMNILHEVSDGTRILPSLLRLLRHENPRIRSKAVLMIGRASRGVRWVERRMADEDQRVRANAIESMWGMDLPDARDLLHKTLRDPNSRVAGNAALGLYLLGDCSAIPEILQMAESHAPFLRSAATWVMGRTGDPRFLGAVAMRLQDADWMVRRRAFTALVRIRAAAAKVAQTPEWRMAGHFLPAERGGRTRRVRLAVASPEGDRVPAIRPTQFLLEEDGQPVNQYQVTEHEMPPALSVAFVFPKSVDRAEPPWIEGALDALPWKRPSDLWGLATYRTDTGWEGEPRVSGERTGFGSTADAIRTAFLHPKCASCPDLWTAIWNAVQGQDRLVRGDRRVIVFSNAAPISSAGHGLISATVSSSTEVQAVSMEDNPRLEDFCRRTRGRFRRVGGEEEAAAAIGQACLQLLARYEIAWWPVSPEPREVKIRGQTMSGWAEMTLAMPAEPAG